VHQWIIIHPINSKEVTTPIFLKAENVRVAQEVHLLPGVPALTQCEHLSLKKEPIFHLDEDFILNKSASGITISHRPKDNRPFPIIDYKLSDFTLLKGGCSCGKDCITRT
jgi:hypothetical protein